jgi:hypothetical protein
MIAGTGLTAYGMYQQGQAAAEEGRTAQQLYNYNAKLKEQQAAAEVRRARVQAEQFRQEGLALMGEQQVNLAKGGVLTSSGSPELLMEKTAENLEADRQRILNEGYLAQSYALSEAEGLRYQGRAAKAQGYNRRTGYRYGALGSLLTGFGNMYPLFPPKTPGMDNLTRATIARY